MKVLHVINSLKAGGAEKLLIDATRLYVEKGLKVDLLLLDGLRTAFHEKLLAIPDVNIFHLGENNNVYSPSNIFKIAKYLKSYDIVHVHLFPASYFVALASLKKKGNYKLIFTEHNTTNRRRNSKLWKPLERFIYRQYDAIVSISDAVDLSIKNHLGNNFDSINQINNGIDLEEINDAQPYFKTELGFKEEQKLLLQVSSFTAQKDQQTAIKALKYMEDYVHLLLVGEGTFRKECEQLSREMDLSDRVHFLGFRNDVSRLLKTVDVVLLSSHYEGLSLASVEGLASSKPFIASDVPGLTDVVLNAGILFKNGDSKDLALKIKKLLNDKIYYQNTVVDCKVRAKSYDIKKMVDQYISLYNEII